VKKVKYTEPMNDWSIQIVWTLSAWVPTIPHFKLQMISFDVLQLHYEDGMYLCAWGICSSLSCFPNPMTRKKISQWYLTSCINIWSCLVHMWLEKNIPLITITHLKSRPIIYKCVWTMKQAKWSECNTYF
jgi:hypothetical protein